ncbi:twin-arginine translocase TatA/TatE family subunit [Fibrobacterota bacterium]
MELTIILLIVLLIFGGKKIPEIAKGLGKGIKEFKSAQKEPNKLEEDENSTEKTEKIEEKPKDS